MTDGICPFATWIPVSSFTAGGQTKVGFCDHTAGGWYHVLANPSFWNGNGLSVHFIIGRKGEIGQLVNIFNRAYGQGILGPVVSWPPYVSMGRVNPNEYLISTEHEDYEMINGVAKHVTYWTEAEYQADLKVKRWCIEEIQRVQGADLMRFQIDSLAGHHMFDNVNRPECPGKDWRNAYRQNLFTDLTTGDDMYHKLDTWAGFFSGLEIVNGTPQDINVQADFMVPPEAKVAEIEFLCLKGYVEVFHGDGQVAGSLGWGVPMGQAWSRSVKVVPSDSIDPRGAGWITLKANDTANPVKFFGARGIGYWV